MAGLLATFLAGAPFIAIAAGSWAHAWGPPGAARPPGSRAGSTGLMWADRSGPVTGVPLIHDVITARVIAAGLLASAFLAFVLLGIARLARWMLARRRLVAWEASWTLIGPQWTLRR